METPNDAAHLPGPLGELRSPEKAVMRAGSGAAPGSAGLTAARELLCLKRHLLDQARVNQRRLRGQMPPHQGVDILERILGDRGSRRASRRAVEGEGVGLSRVR